MKKFSFLFLFVLLFTFVCVGCKDDEPATYTVEFNSMLGTSVESQTVKENELAVKPADPTRDGYAFAGWYLADDEYDFNTPVKSNLILDAHWEQLLKVEFFGGLKSDQLVDTQYVKKGESAVAPDSSKVPVVEGYTFNGWTGNYSNVQADTKITASYKQETFTVKFYVFGELYLEVTDQFYGDQVDAPTLLDVTGYTFIGWDKSAELLEITGNLEVNAIYEPIKYDVKFYLCDEEYSDLQAKYDIVTGLDLPTNIEREGYTFVGWYDNAALSGEAVTAIETGVTGDKVFYAKFSGTTSVLVDTNVADKQAGTNYELNGETYVVGTTVFATISEAVNGFKYDGSSLIVTVLAGTYKDDVTLAASNITLVGPNNEVNPNGTTERKAEAVITGVITLKADIDNITISGFKFEGNAQVIGEQGSQKGDAANILFNHENFIFKNNIVKVTLKAEEDEEIKGFIVLNETTNSYNYNTQIVDNVFEGASDTDAENMLFIDNNEDLKVLNNVFRNISGTAIWVEDTSKGCSGYDVKFAGNTFENIGGSGIWLSWISPRNGSTNSKYVFEENIFNCVGTTADDCAIYLGSTNNSDKIAEISLTNNEFTSCTVCINVYRSHETAQVVIDGSVFHNSPEYYYVVCKNTSATKPTKVKLTNAVFYNAYASSQFVSYVELTEDTLHTDVIVSSEWAEKTTGETVTVDGKEYTIGTNAFATLKEAAEKEYTEATYITVLPGTYAESFTIVSNNLTLNGPAGAINGTATRPEKEAIITGVITLEGSVSGLRIDGFRFEGNAQIIGKAGTAGEKNNVAYNHENINFVNNVVKATLSETVNGFIVFAEASNSYSHNLTIKNNLFELAEDNKAKAIIALDNVENLYILDNKFVGANQNAIYVDDASKGLSGLDCSISGNTFEDVKGTAILVDWISPKLGSTNSQFKFDNNIFNAVGTAMNLGKTNNDDVIKLYSITGNTFKTSLENGIVIGKAVNGAKYVINGNLFEVVPSGVYFDIKSTTETNYETIVDVINNEYKEEGNTIIELDEAKFVGDIEYKKGEATVTYNLGGYETHAELVTEFLTDFYNWLVAKDELKTTEITLDEFLDNKETDKFPFDGKWYNYIGCEGQQSLETAYPTLSEKDLMYNKDSETIDEGYFVNSSEYIEKWGKLLDVISAKYNKWNNRVWSQKKVGGAYDLTKWINAYVSSSYNDANLVVTEYNKNFITSEKYSKTECTIKEVPAKEGYVGSWNTKADGTGLTITALDPENIVDLVLYAVYTPVQDGE